MADRSYFFKKVVIFSIIFVFVFILGFFILSFLNSADVSNSFSNVADDLSSDGNTDNTGELGESNDLSGSSESGSSTGGGSSGSGSGGGSGSSGDSGSGSDSGEEEESYSQNSCSLVRPGNIEGIDCSVESIESSGVVLSIYNSNSEVNSASLSLDGCGSEITKGLVLNGETDFSFSCEIGENFVADLTAILSLNEGSVEINGFVSGSVSN